MVMQDNVKNMIENQNDFTVSLSADSKANGVLGYGI